MSRSGFVRLVACEMILDSGEPVVIIRDLNKHFAVVRVFDVLGDGPQFFGPLPIQERPLFMLIHFCPGVPRAILTDAKGTSRAKDPQTCSEPVCGSPA